MRNPSYSVAMLRMYETAKWEVVRRRYLLGCNLVQGGDASGDGVETIPEAKRLVEQNKRLLREEFARQIRRREMPNFALPRRNFIPLFYGVSQIFLRPRKIRL